MRQQESSGGWKNSFSSTPHRGSVGAADQRLILCHPTPILDPLSSVPAARTLSPRLLANGKIAACVFGMICISERLGMRGLGAAGRRGWRRTLHPISGRTV
jgi:hypothetical protein